MSKAGVRALVHGLPVRSLPDEDEGDDEEDAGGLCRARRDQSVCGAGPARQEGDEKRRLCRTGSVLLTAKAAMTIDDSFARAESSDAARGGMIRGTASARWTRGRRACREGASGGGDRMQG